MRIIETTRRSGRPGPKRRFVDQGRRAVGLAVLAGVIGTLGVSVLPAIKFAYRSEEAHIAIETAATLVPALVALLFGGRALRGHSRTDVLLAGSLALIAVTNLCFSLLPGILEDEPTGFTTWAPVGGRLLGAAGFAAAALMPDRRLVDSRRALAQALAVAGVIAVGIAVLAALFADDMPRGIDPVLSPESAGRPRNVGDELVLGVQLLMLALYAAATVGFVRRAERGRDDLLVWVAVAASLSAFARLNYFLFPSLYSEWVYVGDVLRLASYLVLLVGLGRELLAYQRGAAYAAVFEERRRLARELHDGLAQELAFLRSEGARLSQKSGGDDRGIARMASAAERALGEARTAIAELTTPVDEPLESSLRRAAEAVAGRAGAQVEVRCLGEAETNAATRQSLERIVREAATNAVRHGNASQVRVEIDASDILLIRLTDNGSGFDTSAPAPPDSFGLQSMRERAEAMGAQLDIRSVAGEGTTVELSLPGRGETLSDRRG